MSKYIPSIIIVAIVAVVSYAAQLSYTTAQVENAIAVVEGEASINSLTFTNGWVISATGTNLTFVKP